MGSKRILGDLRIFQAVHNDLHLLHQADKHAYVYPGIDPYELGDRAFPTITEALHRLVTAARAEGIKQGNQILVAELKKAVALADKQARIDELKRNAYYSQPHKSDPLELCGIEMSAEQVNKRLAELEAK